MRRARVQHNKNEPDVKQEESRKSKVKKEDDGRRIYIDTEHDNYWNVKFTSKFLFLFIFSIPYFNTYCMYCTRDRS